MANGQHGGHRTPHNPAPASGPGRLSKRTDGGPGQKLQAQTGGAYGAREDSLQQQRSAPMSQQDSITPTPVPSGGGAGGAGGGGAAPPFGAPTARPDEPITHGVDIGPGAGAEVLGLDPTVANQAAGTGQMTALLQRLSASDTTGLLGQLMQKAAARNA